MNVPCDDLSACLSDRRLDDAKKDSVPALLALKRFIRKTLRHLGVALASVMIILGLNAHGAEHIDFSSPQDLSNNLSDNSSDAHFWVTTGTASSLSQSASQFIHQPASRPLSKPFQLLAPKMTQHRLTGARLSIPSTSEQPFDPPFEQTVASLSEPGLSEPN
jgi:hypothetical protein